MGRLRGFVDLTCVDADTAVVVLEGATEWFEESRRPAARRARRMEAVMAEGEGENGEGVVVAVPAVVVVVEGAG